MGQSPASFDHPNRLVNFLRGLSRKAGKQIHSDLIRRKTGLEKMLNGRKEHIRLDFAAPIPLSLILRRFEPQTKGGETALMEQSAALRR